jgi:hypothetical protein
MKQIKHSPSHLSILSACFAMMLVTGFPDSSCADNHQANMDNHAKHQSWANDTGLLQLMGTHTDPPAQTLEAGFCV